MNTASVVANMAKTFVVTNAPMVLSNQSVFNRNWSRYRDLWMPPSEANLIAQNVIFYVALPVTVAIGTVANMLIFILLRCQPRKTSVHVYLSIISLANCLILMSGSGYTWLITLADVAHVGVMAGWTCRLWQFSYNMIIYTPNWIIVIMLIDQILLLRYPVQAVDICNPCMAKAMLIIVEAVLVSVSIHVLWTYELLRVGCHVNTRLRNFFTTIWPYVSASIYLYLPIVLTIGLAIAIGVSLQDKHLLRRISNSVGLSSAISSYGRQPKLTLCLAIAFTVLILPGVVFNIISHLISIHPANWALTFLICQLFSCIGYASPPFVCLLSDRSFLRQLAVCSLRHCCACCCRAIADRKTEQECISPTSAEPTACDDETERLNGTAHYNSGAEMIELTTVTIDQ